MVEVTLRGFKLSLLYFIMFIYFQFVFEKHPTLIFTLKKSNLQKPLSYYFEWFNMSAVLD